MSRYGHASTKLGVPFFKNLSCGRLSVIQVGFFAKGSAKSMVAIQHQKLRDRSAVAATKTAWAERFDRLSQVLS